MKIHIFILETEVERSETSVETVWPEHEARLKADGWDSSCELLLARNFDNLQPAFERFVAWTKGIPEGELILFWVSIHGDTREEDSPVGTQGHADQFGKVEWYNTLAPAVCAAHVPSRIVVLMDVCWGASPTAARTLTRSGSVRPYALIGPRRTAYRDELDAIFESVIEVLRAEGIPCDKSLRQSVDKLNRRFPDPGEGDLCRLWTWEGRTLVAYPELRGIP